MTQTIRKTRHPLNTEKEVASPVLEVEIPFPYRNRCPAKFISATIASDVKTTQNYCIIPEPLE